jgi:hypothetical protein
VELTREPADIRDPAERLHYASVLNVGMKLGLAVLAITLFIYVSGWLPTRVSVQDLPSVWSLSASAYVRAAEMPLGWRWILLLEQGDVLPLIGVALLSAVPMISVLALAPLYAARRDWIYLVIVIAQAAVIALAASGVFASFH